MTQPDDDYVGWLVEHSMLHNAKKLAVALRWSRAHVAATVCRSATARGIRAGLGLVHRLPCRDCDAGGRVGLARRWATRICGQPCRRLASWACIPGR